MKRFAYDTCYLAVASRFGIIVNQMLFVIFLMFYSLANPCYDCTDRTDYMVVNFHIRLFDWSIYF